MADLGDLRGRLADLLNGYAHYADRFDLDRYTGLFSDDAHIDMMGQRMSKADLRAMMEQNQKDTLGRSPRHVLSNLMFTDLSASAASGVLYYTYHQQLDGKPTMLMSGTYTFELALNGDQWQISRWLIEVDQGA